MAARQGVLFSQPDNFHGFKARIAAKYGKFDLSLEKVSSVEKLDRQRFPLNKLPAFQCEEISLNNAPSIAYYVGNDQIRGSDPVQKARVLQWVIYAEGDLYHDVASYVYPMLGLMESDVESIKKAEKSAMVQLKLMESYLLHETYLAGDRITVADICAFCNLLTLFTKVMDQKCRKDYVNVMRWFDTLRHQPEFKEVVGELALCEEAPKMPTKPKKEPKATKKEAAPKPAAVASDDFGDEPPKEKEKDPFAPFPKGTFDMDDFKRFYSNNDVEPSVEYFWQKFDPEHYSIWHCEYLFPDELKLVFMSCNLISGMFQRLDKLNKNAFASMILFGKDNDSTISGIWVWRSHELAFTLSENWQTDYQSYKWTKLDPSNKEHREMVNEYLKWEGKFDGKEFNQGKIFK